MRRSQSSYVLKGSLEYNFDGEKQIVREGDTIYLPPETKHGVVALEESILLDVFTPQREDFLSGNRGRRKKGSGVTSLLRGSNGGLGE